MQPPHPGVNPHAPPHPGQVNSQAPPGTTQGYGYSQPGFQPNQQYNGGSNVTYVS